MGINTEKWELKKFSDIVENITQHEKNALSKGISKFVSLEHIKTGNWKIEKCGDLNEESSTFSKFFCPGDTLFGKRRSYLRKVARPNFQGVCSGDILVFRAKNGVPSELITYVASSNRFIDYAVSTSAGSLSPRTKWKDLADYRLKLPPKKEMEEVTKLLLALDEQIEKTIEQEENIRSLSKKMIDNFVNGFQFGKLLDDAIFSEYKWSECVNKVDRNIDPKNEGIKFRIGGENINTSDYKIRTVGSVVNDYTGPAFVKKVIPNDILYVSRNPHLRKVAFAEIEGVCANTTFVIRSKTDILHQDLLKHIMLSEPFSRFSMSKARGSTNPYINWKDLNDFKFKLPDLDIQRKMADILDDCIANAEIAREQSITLKKLKHKLLDEIFE